MCSPTADPRYTSLAGDDYCLVPWVDTTCANGESRPGARVFCGWQEWLAPRHHRPLASLSSQPALLCAASAAGQEYNPESESCVMCPAGTQRLVGREDACMPW